MRHDSVEPIYFPVIGSSGWPNTATAVQVSQNGTTWQNATVIPETATAVTLQTGVAGTRCWISVPATAFTLVADSRVQFYVRLTNGSDTPVMTANGKFSIE